MAPSIFSTLSSALLLTSTVSAAQSYQVVDSYDSTNFLDKFGFFVSDHTTGNYNDVDPTGGYVSYKSADEAKAMGLLKTVGNDLYLGVDSTNKLDPKGTGRSSVRIQSKTKYKKGLFVADFSHFPKPTCGAWPAFWTVGNPWPSAGEIDIYESWNLDPNKVVIHSDSNVGECRIDGKGMTGTMSKPNCANFAPGQFDNEGCAGLDSSPPFGSPSGGVYAMEWTDDAIRVWGFTHENTPADLSDPSTFGIPSFKTSSCEAGKVFGDQQLIMNIDLCGVAGNDDQWITGGCQAKTGGMTCHEYVAAHPGAFADVFFQLSSLKIYELKDGEAPAPTTAASSSAVAVAPTSAGEVVAPSSSAPAPEKPTAETSVPAASEPGAEKPTATAAVPENGAEKPTATAAVPENGADKPSGTTAVPETPVETRDLTTRLATSTVYETNIKTITSCPPTKTDCPARHTPEVVTEVVPVTTTICPVVDVPTTMTVSRTQVVTVTSCSNVPGCQVGSKTTLTTAEVVPTTTAIPVESYTKPVKPPVVTSQAPVPEGPTAITTYKTNIVTITSCPPSVPSSECPVGKTSTIVTSEVIVPTAPAPGVPATPTDVPQNPPANPPAPGTEKPTTPAVPGVEKPKTPAAPGVEQPATTPVVPVTPCIGVGCPATTPGQGKPSVPAVGQTTSAEQPVPETPVATPTTLVVAPSSPYNGTLTTAIPVGTGTPCLGVGCPATTTGPVQAGADKVGSSALALVAALAVFAF
ncbi:mixed-linked glucanase [Colletotrichum sojae]|uniref:Mixed-linked glucanase n=1 Tax=Colletotrichum sojae TaxID=2175907 RepID=A0A8H6MX87_9PEZI|nr:mixed-linked glucanase [Colletotrichum sojae]